MFSRKVLPGTFLAPKPTSAISALTRRLIPAKVFYDSAQQPDTLFIAVSVPRWGRECKREIDALQSNCIEFGVLNLERTEIIPVPVAPGPLDKGLDDVGHF